jgi:hypothetical protein
LGLGLVALGNLATAAAVGWDLAFPFVAIATFVTGCGAGFLNGETAKVSMSVVPPERRGMASGIAATLRFIGLVTGMVGLGAILTTGTENYLHGARLAFVMPWPADEDLQSTVSRIVAGDAVGAVSRLPGATQAKTLEILRHSFVHGFTHVLLVAAALAMLAAVLTYWLVSARETAPIHPPATTTNSADRVTPATGIGNTGFEG